MIKLLVHLLVDAIVLLVAAKMMSSVHVRSFGTAIWVAILIGIFSFLIGWLLTLILNIATLGIFFFTGLGFIIRIIVNAIIIEIVDKVSKGFETKGFTPSLILAVLIAFVSWIVDYILFSSTTV
jgi:putative membrane protein